MLRIDATDQLAGQPAVGDAWYPCVEPIGHSGVGVGEARRDRVPVERLGERDVALDAEQAALVAEQLRDGGVTLAVRGELGPVRRDRLRRSRAARAARRCATAIAVMPLVVREHQLQRARRRTAASPPSNEPPHRSTTLLTAVVHRRPPRRSPRPARSCRGTRPRPPPTRRCDDVAATMSASAASTAPAFRRRRRSRAASRSAFTASGPTGLTDSTVTPASLNAPTRSLM